MTNFKPFQTERVCRRQFQIGRKWKKVIQTGRKDSGKGEIPRYKRQKGSLCGNGLISIY